MLYNSFEPFEVYEHIIIEDIIMYKYSCRVSVCTCRMLSYLPLHRKAYTPAAMVKFQLAV